MSPGVDPEIEAVNEQVLCDFCGGPVPDCGWIGLEVSRSQVPESPLVDDEYLDYPDYLDVIFCCQEHASMWLARPLPEPEPVHLLPQTWGDRLGGVLFIPAISAVLLLAAVGLIASVSWVASVF